MPLLIANVKVLNPEPPTPGKHYFTWIPSPGKSFWICELITLIKILFGYVLCTSTSTQLYREKQPRFANQACLYI